MTKSKNKIVPHLWYDKEAKEAAEFYTAAFPDSLITNLTTIHDTPSGDCDVVAFELAGQRFMAISAGPLFKFNPSISFMVHFDPGRDKNARENLDRLWSELSEGGIALMPLQQYPFSERYGWVRDRFGLSWQLILSNPDGEVRPAIVPSFLFAGAVRGKAEEAVRFYLSVFKESAMGALHRYGVGQEPGMEGKIMYSDFMLFGQWFAVMDSGRAQPFAFNEAISLVVHCDTQEEIDYYWKKLSAVPGSEQCGWLKDKFGVSWQIVPRAMAAMMRQGTRQQIDRLIRAFLPMKKLDLKKLEEAYRGEQ